MISGDTEAAQGKQGAFYNTLSEFAKYWERVDVLVPPVARVRNFANVNFQPTSLKIAHPFFVRHYGTELMRERHYDLMVSHDYGLFLNGWGARWLSMQSGVPYVSEIHHVDGYPHAATWREHWQPWLTRIYVQNAKAMAFRVVNTTELKPLLESWGVPAQKILVLPSLYLDFEIFKPLATEKKFGAIFVGRLTANKAPFLFLQALALANKSHPVKALVVGRGELRSKLETYAKSLQLEVTFVEWVETPHALAELYRSAKCLVCTSYSEGGPRVVAEALACGTPVVTTPVGITREVVGNNENGFICDWQAPVLAEKINQIISDEALRVRLSQNAPQAVARFEKQKVIREYAEGYQRLVR